MHTLNITWNLPLHIRLWKASTSLSHEQRNCSKPPRHTRAQKIAKHKEIGMQRRISCGSHRLREDKEDRRRKGRGRERKKVKKPTRSSASLLDHNIYTDTVVILLDEDTGIAVSLLVYLLRLLISPQIFIFEGSLNTYIS